MSHGAIVNGGGVEAPTREEEHESIGTELQRYIARGDDAKRALDDLHTQGTRVQTQVATLKQQLSDLTAAVSRKTSLLASLEVEVEKVREERDILRAEQASHLQAQEWWTERELRQASGSPVASRDEKGRAIRRAHSEMMERTKLEERMKEIEKEHDEEIEAERAIAAGLRDRLGKLEERSKEQKRELELLEYLHRDEIERAGAASDGASERERKLKAEWNDMKTALDRANEELERLRRPSTSTFSPRALRTMTPNIPVTPPRPSFSSIAPSSADKSQTTPTTSLATRYAALEVQYTDLLMNYRRVCESFENDRRCFKEYKALQLARNKIQKQKKADKKLASSGRSSGSRRGSGTPQAVAKATSTPATSAPADMEEDGEEEEVEYESTDVRVAREAREASAARRGRSKTNTASPVVENGILRSAAVKPDQKIVSPRPVEAPLPSEARPVQRQLSTELRTIQVSESRQLRRGPSHSRNITPVPESRQLGRTPSLDAAKRIEATRTTPWLGASTRRLGPTTSRSNVVDDLDAEMEDTPVQRSTPGPSKPGLIRDRGDHSLRRAALAQSVKPAATPAAPSEGMGESSRKRALDMENLSPAEKALARKKLSKLSTSEKREVYAEYKGKGRYLPPSEVRKDVADEYEIDAKKNEGVKHAFHDVKRGREARKGMHGGDCECCSGYYEAVGPLPVYNAAPKWNDAEEEKDDDEAIKEHQNKVSRHRDTWQKPPTPPGYWSIAFPTTQEVAKQNEDADKMDAEREARMRKEAAQKDGKWKKKT